MAGVEGSLSSQMGCSIDLTSSLPVEANHPPYGAVSCRRSLELPDPGESGRRGPERTQEARPLRTSPLDV